MRSLWKKMALRWLGGRATEGLTGESLIDALLSPVTDRPPTFLLVRRCEVSPHAIMVQPDGNRAESQRAIDEALADAIGKSDPL